MDVTVNRSDAAPGVGAEVARTMQAFLSDMSVEATPRQIAKSARIGSGEFSGLAAYVPMLPGAPFSDALESCARLAAHRLRPVPHMAARSIEDRAVLTEDLPRFVDAGVEDLLLIGGDAATPAGPFASALDVLETGLIEAAGIRRVGLAAHPEGHPSVNDAVLLPALKAKADYGRENGLQMWATTQFLFEAGPLNLWEGRLGDAGVDLPIRVGLPGPASLKAVIAYALRCGVGASAKALARRPETARLLGRWRPDGLLEAIAHAAASRPSSQIAGVHLYAFGGLDASLDWISARRQAMAG